MNQAPDPEEFPTLVNFLSQYRPPTPAPDPGLEEMVVRQALETHRFRRGWLVPPVLAAGLLVALSNYPMAPAPHVRDSAALRDFIVSNWNGVTATNDDHSGDPFIQALDGASLQPNSPLP